MRRLFLVLTLLLLASPLAAFAQPAPTPTPVVTETAPKSRTVQLQDPLSLKKGVPELVGNIISAAVGVVGAFALLIFIYGGFLLLTSGGETAKIQAGKDAMKWSVIGLLVVFSSYTLVKFVLSSLSK